MNLYKDKSILLTTDITREQADEANKDPTMDDMIKIFKKYE